MRPTGSSSTPFHGGALPALTRRRSPGEQPFKVYNGATRGVLHRSARNRRSHTGRSASSCLAWYFQPASPAVAALTGDLRSDRKSYVDGAGLARARRPVRGRRSLRGALSRGPRRCREGCYRRDPAAPRGGVPPERRRQVTRLHRVCRRTGLARPCLRVLGRRRTLQAWSNSGTLSVPRT